MTVRVIEDDWLIRLGNGIERMLKGMPIDRPFMEQQLQELRAMPSFTEWPPEAIEAAAKAIYEEGKHKDDSWDNEVLYGSPSHVLWVRNQARSALAAAWGHITGDK